MATTEYKRCTHTHKQKVRTKEKREVRGIADNNHICLKNQQFARIRLGKKVTVQCPFLIKVDYIVLYSSVVFFDHKSLFTSSYENLNQWLTISCFGMENMVLCKKNKQIQNFVSMHVRIVVTKSNKFLRQPELSTVGKIYTKPVYKI